MIPPDAEGPRTASAVQQASGQVTRTGITFVVACTYFGIVAAATSHADLLTGRTLAIPLLNADVPVLAFFAVAPLIVLLLHLNLLLVQRIYRRSLKSALAEGTLDDTTLRLTAFGTSLAPRALAAGIEPERLVRILLFLLFVVVNVILPLFVLLVLQLQFLPRHSSGMIWWHRAVIGGDALAILYFVPMIISGRGWWTWMKLGFQPGKDTSDGRTRESTAVRGLRRLAVRTVIFLLPLGAILTSTVAIKDSSTVSCEQRYLLPDWFSYHLDLSRGSLSIPSGLRLVDRDLRCARLEGLDLHGIDFRATELAGASFDRSNLSMARFDGARTEGTQKERLPPSFLSTDLRGASLREARLAGGAFLETEASGATFEGADLRMADLSEAVLLGSDLDEAHLEGAILDGARLTCSTATGVRLDLASLQGTHLEAVQLKGSSSAVGADLRDAKLWEAFGLRFEYQNLENAALWGVCPGPWLQEPTYVSMKSSVLHSSSLLGASFRSYTGREWESNVTDRVERMVEGLGKNDRAGDLRVERVIARLPEICRRSVLQEGKDPGVPSQWDDEKPSGRCFPPPVTNPRVEIVLGPEQAEVLKERFRWPVAASSPGAAEALEESWVLHFVRCGDPAWMEILLTRVFLQRYAGLGKLDRRLWDHFGQWKRGECAALDAAIVELCAQDPAEWHRSIDRFPEAAESELRCRLPPPSLRLGRALRLLSPLPP